MLLYYIFRADYLCKGILILTCIATACAVYAYFANSRRPDDDPKKRDFEPAAILLVPFTWPLLLIAFLLLSILRLLFFALRAIAYGIFLVLLTLVLLGKRKPFLFVLIDKIFTSIGNALMEANTFLIRLILYPWASGPN